MSYSIEGKDIVLGGFEKGIAETPYAGIADMRNTDIITVPGEAMVANAMASATLPAAFNAVAFTAQNTGDTITVASTTGLYDRTAIVLNTNSAGGISTGTVYYVGNITATTFQLWVMPALTGSAVAVTSDGSGTLTTYQYGNQRALSGTAYAPVSYFSRSFTTGSPMGAGTLLVDFSNYAWLLLRAASGNTAANSLVFLGNIGGVGASSTPSSAIADWNGYIILIGTSNTDIANISDLWFSTGPALAWKYNWSSVGGGSSGVSGRIGLVHSQEDGNLYFTTDAGIGSLIETPGYDFDPEEHDIVFDSALSMGDTNEDITPNWSFQTSDLYTVSFSNGDERTATLTDGDDDVTWAPGLSAAATVNATVTAEFTWSITESAINLPDQDRATCITELGVLLLIGSRGNFIYTWNKIDPGFSSLLNVPDTFTFCIVAGSQNAYAFTGTRGRIYVTNGTGIDLYKKFPDYLTGVVNPYLRFRSACVDRNQLYFTLTGTTNSGTELTTLAGIWGIDLTSDALRLVNKLTATGYAGNTAMVTSSPTTSLGITVAGIGLISGYLQSGVYGINVGSSTPYTNLEPYIELDMIPVGTFLDRFTPSQVEWKTSVPLGRGGTAETISIYWRENLYDAFQLLGTSTATGTSMVGSTTGTSTGYQVSDYYQASFQNIQWVQLAVSLSSNATTPTYNRLTEVRIRDWPSGKDSKN